jgi:DNA-3-methyladenine glycosylase
MNVKEPIALSRTFFESSADEVARNLIGTSVFVDGVGGVIVETEAYDEGDPASHCSDGVMTALNESMFLAGGHAYVCPGRHMLHLNFTCGPKGVGSAVLIRALRPSPDSVKVMMERRARFAPARLKNPRYLCNGPGCLAQALAIGCKHDGLSLFELPFEMQARIEAVTVAQGARIGVTNGGDLSRRYGLIESPSFLSKAMSCPPNIQIG